VASDDSHIFIALWITRSSVDMDAHFEMTAETEEVVQNASSGMENSHSFMSETVSITNVTHICTFLILS
jgi:hypothetical protein